MNQPTLPYTHLHVPIQHLHWFRYANGGDYWEKQRWFYPFKERFLRAHALPDGVTIQTIIKKCWCGDGIWRGVDHDVPRRFWDTCWKCGGTGIYDTKQIVLTRWLLYGYLYHNPTYWSAEQPGLVVRDRISGIIKHGDFSSALAKHAMERLLLRYEPRDFLNLYLERFRTRKREVRQRLWWRYRGLYYRVTGFWKHEEDSDIPF